MRRVAVGRSVGRRLPLPLALRALVQRALRGVPEQQLAVNVMPAGAQCCERDAAAAQWQHCDAGCHVDEFLPVWSECFE